MIEGSFERCLPGWANDLPGGRICLGDWVVGRNYDIFTDIAEGTQHQAHNFSASIDFMKDVAVLMKNIGELSQKV